MANRKKLIYPILAVLLLVSFAPLVSATEVSIGYSFTNQDALLGAVRVLHPSASGAMSASAQVFNSTDTFYLQTATFYLDRTNNPNYHIQASLWGVTGTAPNTSMLANSTSVVEASTVDETGEQITFYFDGSYELTEGTLYAIGIYVSEYTFSDATNYTKIGADSSSPSFAGGTAHMYDTSAWSAVGYDLVFELTGDSIGGFYEDDPYDWGEGMGLTLESFMEFIVPLFVMLFPAFLLCFIARRVDKWLILIGLAIGTGLGYYFGMVPLWLVFLVSIGLIGFSYSEVRRNG